MKKILLIAMCFVSVNAFAVYTPVMPNGAFPLTGEEAGGQPNYMQSFRDGMEASREAAETVYAPHMLAENLRAQQLQNEMLKIQLSAYLAAHPKLAKDMRDKDEFQSVINRNSGFFSSHSVFMTDLKNCSNHGNKYCKNKLDEETVKCKRKHRC